MTDLDDRLDRLAESGARGVRVTRPDVSSRRPTVRRWLPVAVAVASIAAIAGVVVWQRDTGGSDGVTSGPTDRSTSAPPPATTTAPRTPMVAVAVNYGGETGAPSQIRIRFLRPDGTLIADRSWHEVEVEAQGAPGQWYANRGLLQRVPVGTTRVEIEDPDNPERRCTTEVEAAQDSQLVVQADTSPMRGLTPDDTPCATVSTATAWATGPSVAPSDPAAEPYVGLTRAEAETRGKAEGTTVRVTGEDGMDNAVTLDYRGDRVNLRIYDDEVLGAGIG